MVIFLKSRLNFFVKCLPVDAKKARVSGRSMVDNKISASPEF